MVGQWMMHKQCLFLAPRSYCRRSGRLSGPRKPNPRQPTLAGSGKVMLEERSNQHGQQDDANGSPRQMRARK